MNFGLLSLAFFALAGSSHIDRKKALKRGWSASTQLADSLLMQRLKPRLKLAQHVASEFGA
mgnify:CR=1 FL=1